MSVARDICTLALKQAGILGVGQTALSEDMNDTFTLMQQMVAQWQARRWLIPSLQKVAKTWDGQKSNTVGPNGFYNILRPNYIKAAYVIQRNTGTTPVSLGLKRIPSFEDYARIAVKDIQSLPDHFFYDAQYPLGNFYPWPIPQADLYEIHIIVESPIGFGTTIGSGSILEAGTLYTDGNYNNIELTGGNGSGATADITVTAGAVAVVTLLTGGEDFELGDILSADAADIGGTGSGFAWQVDSLTSTIDSEIAMPPEYEEALYLNLSIRLASMYQIQAMPETVRLAKKALNTIKVANTQVPMLTMPIAPGVRNGKAFSLWNPDGY